DMSASLPGGGFYCRRHGFDGLGGADCAEDVVFFHNQVLHAVQRDLVAGVLAKEDGVARFHVERHPLAVLGHSAVARGDDRAPLRFLLRRVGNDDAADVLFAFVEALDENPVVKRSDMHERHSQLNLNRWTNRSSAEATPTAARPTKRREAETRA